MAEMYWGVGVRNGKDGQDARPTLLGTKKLGSDELRLVLHVTSASEGRGEARPYQSFLADEARRSQARIC
jgi:hypothetical protein